MVSFFVKQPLSTETKEAFKREIQTQCMSFSCLLPIRMQNAFKDYHSDTDKYLLNCLFT